MICGVGIDSCEIARMEKSLPNESFCERVFAPEERALLDARGEIRRAATAAGNFAAKEAFLKAAGTGLGGFALNELAVLRTESGAPYYALRGRAAAWLAQNGLTAHVSLTHESGLASAFAVLEKA